MAGVRRMPGTHSASALLEAALNGNLDLDTGAEHPTSNEVVDNADLDITTTDDKATGAAGTTDEGTQGTEQPAPIASKSGSYTIDYQVLVDARNERNSYKQRAAELEQQLQQLSAQQQTNLQQAQADAQARASAGEGQTQADANLATAQTALAQGVDMSLFGDFSEQSIAEGINKMVAAGVQAAIAPLMAERAQTAKQTAQEAHYGAIYAAHKDADEIVQSSEWSQWLQSLPAFMRAATEQTINQGSAEQINEVFSTFKQQSGAGAGQNKPNVNALIAQAQTATPYTLTDVPGGLAAKSGAEQLSTASDAGSLMALMEGKSPEEIERLMNAVV